MSKTDILELEQIEVDTRHCYVLAAKNEHRGMVFDDKNRPRPDNEYPRQRNVLMRSSIIWPKDAKDPFVADKIRTKGRYLIRYYDGCSTLFVDDQPKDKEHIEQLARSTREQYFINGYWYVNDYDTMLKTYADWCSWNENSPYRVPSIDPIFKLLDIETEKKAEAEDLDAMEKALELAKKADKKKMLVHAKFLDVPTIHYITSQPLSEASVRTEYRKAAQSNPKHFIKTYNDKTLSVRFWIEKLLENGEISTTVVPNNAAWSKKGVVICDISGLKDKQLILNKLIEFSQTDEGKEFSEHLKSFSE